MSIQIKRMNDATLVNLVNQHISSSLIHYSGTLAANIKKATEYYYGEPFGNEVEGKSRVVSRDVADTVDWIMPSLMRIFGNGEKTVEFEPTSGEDIAECEQAADYINYIYHKRNNGFLITYQFIKDALLNKNGIVKIYQEERQEPSCEYYTGLSQEALELLLLEEGVEILEKSVMPDGTYEVKLVKTTLIKSRKVEVVPPEEFLIHPEAKDIDSAEFCGHRRRMSVSDLRKLGYPENLLAKLSWNQSQDNYLTNGIRSARHAPDGLSVSQAVNMSQNPAMQKCWVTESYVYVDYDGDGLAELRKIVIADNTLLSNEDCDMNPFAAITPNIVSHKFYGLSLYDKVKDIQEIKSALLRNLLDNMYQVNNGRYAVLDGQVNLDDLLRNNTRGVVREKIRDAIRPLPTPGLPVESFQMLGYLDSIREDRSGVSQTSKGLDGNVLHSNQASSAVNQVMTAAQQQVELIARVIAETGMKKLFQKLYAITVKHQDADDVFKLRNKFVTVSPSEWKKSYNVTVVAGIGNQNKDQQLQHLMRMWEMASSVVQNGGMNILTDYTKLYNLLTKITENAGYQDYQNYWLDPSSPQGQQGIKQFLEAQAKPGPEDIKAQAEAQKVQGNLQIDAQTLTAESTAKAKELEIREREVAVKERELFVKERELDLRQQEIEVNKYQAISDATITSSIKSNVGIGDGKI